MWQGIKAGHRPATQYYYVFYSNPDEKDQKKELESVHDWYLANKPLLFSVCDPIWCPYYKLCPLQSKSRTTRKPAIHVTSTDQKEISRPQTAPALLNVMVMLSCIVKMPHKCS